MNSPLVIAIFFFLTSSLLGGILVSIFRIEAFVGYILAGIFASSFLSPGFWEVEKLAEIGAILLLFSLGVEMSLKRIEKFLKVALLGGLLQVSFSTLILLLFVNLLAFDVKSALVLSLGFSLSSTAVVVKLLSEKGELESIYGQLMVGWLIFQDLAVLPIMIIINSLSKKEGTSLEYLVIFSFKAIFLITTILYLAKKIFPLLIHKIASLNSREVLLLVSFVFALGTALLTSFFGFSAALGAFLAGLVISETQEKYAVFTETRPLRDLFAALFFVTLGFGISFQFIYGNLGKIFLLLSIIFLVKFFIFLLVNFLFGYWGRVAFFSSIGLTQVGEFAFIIFSQSFRDGIIDEETFSLGVAITVLSLFVSPFVFKLRFYFWRKIQLLFSMFPWSRRFLVERKTVDTLLNFGKDANDLKGHVVVCGYGRVGRWVCRALDSLGVSFLVVDYNEKAVREAKLKGFRVIYGDACQPKIIAKANMSAALCVVVAIPDRGAQEELITQIQTLSSSVKIFARAHLDEDFHRLVFLRVNRVVQPEFEAALGIVSSILTVLGKDKSEIDLKIKNLRRQHAVFRV